MSEKVVAPYMESFPDIFLHGATTFFNNFYKKMFQSPNEKVAPSYSRDAKVKSRGQLCVRFYKAHHPPPWIMAPPLKTNT